MGGIDLAIVGLYLLGMLSLGIFAKGQVNDMDDFILGGKRFGTIALTGTIMATMVGSGMTMGSVGNAYEFGATGNVIYMYAGFAIGLFVFSFITKKIRDTGKRTMAEVIASKFGNTSRKVAAIVIIGYAISIVAINIAGLRTVILAVFGDSLSLSIPALTAIATLLAIFYTSTGGLYAVVWMDTIQLGIIIVGIIIIGPIIGMSQAGGFQNIAQTYTAMGSSITNPFYNGISSGALGFFMAYFLTVPADPAMPQRSLAGKNDKVVKNAFLTAGVLALVFGAALVMIGGATFTLAPGLENPELALVYFIANYYPPILKGITIVGVFGAIMSSFDSFLVLATTHIVYDLGTSFNLDINEKTMNKVLSYSTVVIGLIGLVIALYIQSLFTYLYMVFSIVGSSLVPALIGGLYFEDKVSSIAANASMIIGALVPAVLYLTVGYDVFLGDPVFLGIISSTLSLIIISIFTNKKDKELKI